MERVSNHRHLRASRSPQRNPAPSAEPDAEAPAGIPERNLSRLTSQSLTGFDKQQPPTAFRGLSPNASSEHSSSQHEELRTGALSTFSLYVHAVQSRSAKNQTPPSPGAPTSTGIASPPQPEGPSFPPLCTGAEYGHLVTQQAKQGSVSLADIARPGIAVFDQDKEKWTVLQGAGRLEKARPNEWLDLFVEQGTPVPAGTTYAERGLSAKLVENANLLSSRGVAGANPELVSLLTEGKVFDRVFVPRCDAEAPTSKILFDNKRGYDALVAQLGGAAPADQLLARHDFKTQSAVEQRRILQSLGVVQTDDD